MKQKEEALVSYDRGIARKSVSLEPLDRKRIFKMTPNEIFLLWKENETKVKNEVSYMQNEVVKLRKEASRTNNRQKLIRINTNINQNLSDIKNIKQRFSIWTDNIQKGINNTVRSIFSKLLNGAPRRDIEKIIGEFSSEFASSRNADKTVEEILVNFVQGYKNRSLSVVNDSDVEVIDNSNSNIQRRYNDSYPPMNIYDGPQSNNENVKFFGISFYYGSSGSSPKNSKGSGFSSMLTNAMDALSSVLQETLQDTLEEMKDTKRR